MAKATPKARDSMTGEDVKNKTQDNYWKENSTGLKIKPFKKRGKIWKYKEKPFYIKLHFWQLATGSIAFRKVQWGYEETTKDRKKKPQTFKYFLQLKMGKGFIQKKQDRKNFMLLAQNTLIFFHQTSRQTNQEKSKWGSLWVFQSIFRNYNLDISSSSFFF